MWRLISAGLLAGAAALSTSTWTVEDEAPRLGSRARLDAPPELGAHNLRLGSLFSDLFRDPQSPEGEFWAVTDRGPNGEVMRDGRKRRTFAYPEFAPTIVHLRVRNQTIDIIQTLPLEGANGVPLSGLPNRPGIDEEPYDCSAGSVLRYDPAGVDTEGIIRLPSGEFWLSEEYGPSLLRVSADGVVLERLVPRGVSIVTSAYPVRESLPSVFARRAQNRGIESLAVSADHRTLFAILQSPLGNPDSAAAKSSRITRVLKMDARSGAPIGEYALLLAEAAAYGASSQNDIKVSAAIWLAEDRLLVVERTDETARVLEVDLRAATNILDSAWDDEERAALEALSPEALTRAGVIPSKSRLVADLGRVVADLPGKIEGMALADDHTLVFGNDNEFAFNGCDDARNAVPVNRPSELLFLRFGKPLR